MQPDPIGWRPSTLLGNPVVAWRCENCRKFQAASIASYAVLVDEVAEGWYATGAVKRRRRFARYMVVCPPCRRSIVGDLPGEEAT